MPADHCDALVFFGATGDLAYKKIFPALQAMIKRGHLSVPVIGVAKANWTLEQFRARAKDSLEKHSVFDAVAFGKLSNQLRYVDGDYADNTTVHKCKFNSRTVHSWRHAALSCRHKLYALRSGVLINSVGEQAHCEQGTLRGS